MTIKCMITTMLFTCCVMLLIIIFTDLNKKKMQYFLRNDFMNKFTNVKNEKILFNNNANKILNFKTFQYVIDINCNYLNEDFENLQDRKLKIVWIITSFAGDISKRNALRQAYTINELKKLRIQRIFLLGILDEQLQKKTGITQLAIENEAHRFQDIIQGNFIEAYKNLTYKHLMGLQWAVDKCRNKYSYIMKMDDDVIVNLYEAKVLLQNKSNSNNNEDFLMGYVLEHMIPIRNKANKWFVSNEEFREKIYPPFLSGWFYIINMLTASKLINQSKYYLKYFWIDDLFVTGILREEAKIHNIINIKEFFTSDYKFLKCCLKQQKLLKYKCDFIIGPNGGNTNLLLAFQKFSKHCYQYNCKSRPEKQLLKNTCILDSDYVLDTGSVQIEKQLSNVIS